MKIPILISLVMWWLAAPVRGAGVDIAWDGCLGDPEAVSFKSYDCQSAGQDQLLVSFVPAVSFNSVLLMEVAIELRTQSGAAMPAWWDVYGLNSCRRDGFVVDAYPPVVATPACEPWYLGSSLETSYDWRYPTADVARLVIQGLVSSVAWIAGHRCV